MSGHYFVTTPIYYANAEPHIGHTYTTVVVDTLVRWHRLRGETTFSVSGTDEHGEKMVEAAAARGISPAAFTEAVSATHQRTWDELGLRVDRFVRTTDPAHVRNVTAVLQHVWDAGWIELREYEGLYCVGCERFLTERDLENGLCRDHERAPETRRETNYFFLMSREFGWLRRFIEEHPDFIRPARYRNEALAMLRDESGLGDLSISRPKTRLDWGVELPFDRDHVCYVWFDALISYLTGAGFDGAAERQSPEFEARWANAEHLIGKDILKPHAIFWPIMLKAIGLAPYRHLSVHGYWNVDDREVAESLSNMISVALASSDAPRAEPRECSAEHQHRRRLRNAVAHVEREVELTGHVVLALARVGLDPILARRKIRGERDDRQAVDLGESGVVDRLRTREDRHPRVELIERIAGETSVHLEASLAVDPERDREGRNAYAELAVEIAVERSPGLALRPAIEAEPIRRQGDGGVRAPFVSTEERRLVPPFVDRVGLPGIGIGPVPVGALLVPIIREQGERADLAREGEVRQRNDRSGGTQEHDDAYPLKRMCLQAEGRVRRG